MNNSLVDNFFNIDADDMLNRLANIDEVAFSQAADDNILKMFHTYVPRIPAYKDFLKKNNIDEKDINTIDDYRKLPIISKENYLIQYDLESRCIDGKITQHNMLITSSSGTSGKPHFWPWLVDSFPVMAGIYELVYRYNFNIQEKTTLVLNCYGLGVWPAGSVIYSLSMMLSLKGYNVTTINTGLDMSQAVNMLREISPKYDQTIINGYPPFIKDLLDMADKSGIDLPALQVKIFTGGERFTNGWRNYLYELLKADSNRDIASLYAASEMGVAGFESPICNLVRDIAEKNEDFKNALFGEADITTFVQYNPMGKYMEIIDGRFVVSSIGGAPLFRYDMKDMGTIIKYSDLEVLLVRSGVKVTDLPELLNVTKIVKLPFLTVSGRNDNTVTLYAVNIYPQHIEMAISNDKYQEYVTGKFVMSTMFTDKQDQYLNIDIESSYSKNIPGEIQDGIKNEIIHMLKMHNSEFNKLHESLGDKVLPQIAFKPYGAELFVTNNKHRYVKR